MVSKLADEIASLKRCIYNTMTFQLVPRFCRLAPKHYGGYYMVLDRVHIFTFEKKVIVIILQWKQEDDIVHEFCENYLNTPIKAHPQLSSICSAELVGAGDVTSF